VLTNTPERLELIIWYLKNSDVRKPVMLALFEDLFKSSVLDCEWHLPFSDSRATLWSRFFKR
jgi:hypothetical protein